MSQLAKGPEPSTAERGDVPALPASSPCDPQNLGRLCWRCVWKLIALPIEVGAWSIVTLKNWLWGYDFFISYHWASGGTYAVNLAARLREKGYDVFLDRAEYATGDKWKGIGEVALRNTQRLVLIATREAVFESKPVEHEVVKFTDRGRHCIPIFFGETFTAQRHHGASIVLNRLPEDTLHVEDAIENLATGPAAKVVEELIDTHGKMRRRKLRQTITVVTVCLLTLFALGATLSAIRSKIANDTTQQTLAETYLQNGHQAINVDADLGAGVLWYAKTLETTGGKAKSARRSARSLLGGWSHYLPRAALVHDSTLGETTFSSDGQILAAITRDQLGSKGEVQLWDIRTCEPIGCPFPHDEIVNAAVLSQDGTRLAIVGGRTAWLWNVRAHKKTSASPLRHVKSDAAEPEFLFAASFAPDGKTLVTAGQNSARQWVVATGEPKGQPLRHLNSPTFGDQDGAQINAVAFSPNGDTIATGGMDDRLCIWSPADSSRLFDPLEHPHWVNDLVFDQRGEKIAALCFSVTSDGFDTISSSEVITQVWDLAADKPTKLNEFGRTAALASTRDGLRVLQKDGATLRIWSDDGNDLIDELPLWNDASGSPGLSANGKTALLALSDSVSGVGVVKLWDMPAKRMPRQVDAIDMTSSSRAGFNQRGDLVAVTYDLKGEFKVWSTDGDDEPHAVKVSNGYTDFAAIVVDPDGDLVATLEKGRAEVAVWSAREKGGLGRPLRHKSPVRGMSLGSDGVTLATGCTDGSVWLWNMKSGVHLWQGKTASPVSTVAFSSDHRTLATGHNDGVVHLWNISMGERPDRTLSNRGIVESIAFSPNGGSLAVATSNPWGHTDAAEVTLWNVTDGSRLRPSKRHKAKHICYDPGGEILATLSEAGNVQLWDSSTLQPRGLEIPLRFPGLAIMFLDYDELIVASPGSVHQGRGGVEVWNVPPPVEEPAQSVLLSIEVRTGKTIEGGFIRRLTQTEWLMRKSTLERFSKPLRTRPE